MTLDKYFEEHSEHNGILREYVTTTDQQSHSVQDLVRASQNAHTAKIAEAEAVQKTTVAYKAGTAAAKAFSAIGNMAAIWLITEGISALVWQMQTRLKMHSLPLMDDGNIIKE